MWLVYKLYFTLIITQLVKNLPAMQESLHSWVRKIRWRRDRLPNPVFLGFPCGSAGKESTCNERDLGSVPGLGRFPGEGKGYPLQYSGLENSMDCIVRGFAKSRTWLSDLEKEMATHSSILAWRIPWMEEPRRLQSMGLQRVGHNWATSLLLFLRTLKLKSIVLKF